MIRCASLAALCAFGLTNVAHASFALTTADTSGVVADLTVVGSTPPVDLISSPVAPGSDGVSLTGGLQPVGATPNSGGSVSLTDLNFDASTGALYGSITGGTTGSGGGDLTIHQGALDLPGNLLTTGGGSGSGSTVTVTAPTSHLDVTPIEPPPGGWITPPFFPTPAPTYPQQPGMACSGAFSVVFGAQTTVNCQADLWFTQGYVAANQSIVANALGNILVDDVSFVAPSITFNAGANFVTSLNPLWLDGNTTINALGVNIAGPLQTTSTTKLSINSQTINLQPAIPEPSTWALMGLGLVGLSLAARRKA